MTISLHLKGIIAMVLSCALFVANDTAMKFVLADLPPFQVLTMRGIAASLLCAIVVWTSGNWGHVHYVGNRYVALRSFCEVLAVISFVVALTQMPIAETTAIYQTSPLLLLVGAQLIWGEKIGWLRFSLVSFGIAGALLVAQPGAAAASPYALLGFCTAIGAAARDLVGRKVPKEVPGLVVAFSTVITVLGSGLVGHLLFETWVAPTPIQLSLMILAGSLVATAHYFVFITFRFAPAAVVAPFYYTATVWAAISGFLVFADVPNKLAFIGMALIILAGLAIIILDQRKPKEET